LKKTVDGERMATWTQRFSELSDANGEAVELWKNATTSDARHDALESVKATASAMTLFFHQYEQADCPEHESECN
jgi:hypothetical protein